MPGHGNRRVAIDGRDDQCPSLLHRSKEQQPEHHSSLPATISDPVVVTMLRLAHRALSTGCTFSPCSAPATSSSQVMIGTVRRPHRAGATSRPYGAKPTDHHDGLKCAQLVPRRSVLASSPSRPQLFGGRLRAAEPPSLPAARAPGPASSAATTAPRASAVRTQRCPCEAAAAIPPPCPNVSQTLPLPTITYYGQLHRGSLELILA